MLYSLYRNVVLNVAELRCNKIVVFKIQGMTPRPHSQTRNEHFVTGPLFQPPHASSSYWCWRSSFRN